MTVLQVTGLTVEFGQRDGHPRGPALDEAMPVCQASPPGAPAGPGHRALCWLYDPATRAGAA